MFDLEYYPKIYRTAADGRHVPITDWSETIVGWLIDAAKIVVPLGITGCCAYSAKIIYDGAAYERTAVQSSQETVQTSATKSEKSEPIPSPPSEAFLKTTLAQSEGLKIQLRAIPWGSAANAGIRNAEEAFCGKFIQDCTLVTDTNIARNYQLLADAALTGDGAKNGIVVKAFSDFSTNDVAPKVAEYNKATTAPKLQLKRADEIAAPAMANQ